MRHKSNELVALSIAYTIIELMHPNIHKRPAYLLSQAILFLITNKPEEALANLDASLSLHHSEDATTWRGITRFLLHDFEGALVDFGVWDATPGSGGWRSRGHETNLSEYTKHTQWKRWPWPRPENYLEMQWAVIQSQWSAALDVFEQAGVREPTDSRYLSERFSEYCSNGWTARGPAQYPRALRDAEAVLAADTAHAYGRLRELRADLRVKANDLDYAALLEDYKCLLEQAEILQADPSCRDDPNWENRVDLAPLYRPHYARNCAWALYRLGDLAGSRQYFATALAYTYPPDSWSMRWWNLTQIPPVPDAEYLLWQVRQQLPLDDHCAYSWLSAALNSIPKEMIGELAYMFSNYAFSNPQAHTYRVDPDNYFINECLKDCQEQLDKAPAVVLDLYQMVYQLVLQAHPSKHLPGTVKS